MHPHHCSPVGAHFLPLISLRLACVQLPAASRYRPSSRRNLGCQHSVHTSRSPGEQKSDSTRGCQPAGVPGQQLTGRLLPHDNKQHKAPQPRCNLFPGSPSHFLQSGTRQRRHSPSTRPRPGRHSVHFPLKSSQSAQPVVGQTVQFTPALISGRNQPWHPPVLQNGSHLWHRKGSKGGGAVSQAMLRPKGVGMPHALPLQHLEPPNSRGTDVWRIAVAAAADSRCARHAIPFQAGQAFLAFA